MSIKRFYKPVFLPIALMAAGLWLFFGSLLGQWAGVALIITGLYLAGRSLIPRIPPEVKDRLTPLVFPALLLGLMISAYHKLLMGRMPWIADHSVHQSKAWILWNKLLPNMHLTGWTHFAGPGGYPAETLYPPFADLYIVLVRALTFGLLSWEATYAVAFFAFLVFYVLTFYYVGNRMGGKVAGFVAGLFAMVDVGAFRQGGFIFTVRWGVWPLTLSVALTLLTLTFLNDYLKEKRSPKWAIIAGSISLLTHPMSLMLILPASFFMAWFYFAHGRKLGDLFWRSVLVFCGACALSAWWLIPFFHYGTEYSAHVSALSGTINNLASGLMDPAPWGSAWSWAAALGILGGVELWRRGSAFAMALIATSAFALLGSTTTFLAGLGLFDLMPMLRHVQFPRFLLFVKATAYLAGGYYVGQVLLKKVTTKNRPSRPWAVTMISLAILSALTLPLLHHLYEKKIKPLSDFPTRPPMRAGLQKIARILQKDAADKGGFFRVVLAGSFGEHRTTGFPLLVDRPFVKFTFVPSDTYKYRSKTAVSHIPNTEQEMKLMNVAYVVSVGPYSLKGITEIAREDGVYLYRFDKYTPRRVHCEGCKAQILSFEDREVSLTLSDLPPQGGWIRLPISPFPRWKAYNNGTPLPIHPYKPTSRITYMGVWAKNGSLTFRYEREWPDWTGDLITLFMLLLLIVPARYSSPALSRIGNRVHKRLSTLWDFVLRRSPHRTRWFTCTALIIGLFAGIFILFSIRSFSSPAQLSLSKAHVTVTSGGTSKACTWFYPQRFLCGEGISYVGLESRLVGGEVRTGIFLHPSRDRKYQLTWKGVLLKKGLTLFAAIDDAANTTRGLPLTITASFDGKPLGIITLRRRGEFRTALFPVTGKSRGTLTINFSSSAAGATNCLILPTAN
ncbi:hypothetical protein KKF84_13985 [Myxococcota bacterium]|nr:hypothetical protein [Myxococcota bacterium]MBU1536432.1 hypothetical protein [Myxococcota bacterium]